MGTDREKYVFNFFKASPEEIQEKVQSLVKKIVKILIEANSKEMQMFFEECKAIKYSAQGYLEECDVMERGKETFVQVGYVYALMDVMQMYLENSNAQNEIQQISTKYRDEVLSVLAKRGTMLHGDLASAIQVSASGLNAVIKRMNATAVKLVNVEEVSKYKLYSITPIAYRYITESKPELTIEIGMRNSFEKERRELFMEYAVEICKIMNKRKLVENSPSAQGQKTVWEFKPEKNRKYEKTVVDINYANKICRRLA